MLVEFTKAPEFEALLSQIESLEQLTRGSPGHGLITDLGENSTLLRDLNEKFTSVSKDRKIISCFELQATPTARSLPNEPWSWDRTGPPRMMVSQNSACLYAANETRIAINKNHSMIAKLSKPDPACKQLKSCLAEHVRDSPAYIKAKFSRISASKSLKLICDIGKSVSSVIALMEYRDERNVATALNGALAFFVAFQHFLNEETSMAVLVHAAPSSPLMTAASDSIQELEAQYFPLQELSDNYIHTFSTGELGRSLETVQENFLSSIRQTRRYSFLLQSSNFARLKESSMSCRDKLFRIMLLALLRAEDVEKLEQIKDMESARATGLSKATIREIALRAIKLKSQRSIPLSGSLDQTELRSAPRVQHYHSGRSREPVAVIVENRSYRGTMQNLGRASPGVEEADEAAEKAKAQLGQLVLVLQHLTPETEDDPVTELEGVTDTCMLKCLGYLENRDASSFSLLFKVPDLKNSTIFNDICTLQNMLHSGKYQPTLQQRFRLARAVCVSILHLHCWGWVHKDIRPESILLVPSSARTEDQASVGSAARNEYVAYLSGFEIAREDNDFSDITKTLELKKNLYRHPQRQQTPSRRFTKKDDLYAAGVVLLEIGIPGTINSFMGKVAKRLDETGYAPTPEALSNAIRKLADDSGELPQKMGPRYAEAVRKCLDGKFGIEYDDGPKTELTMAFQEAVLEVVEYGCHL